MGGISVAQAHDADIRVLDGNDDSAKAAVFERLLGQYADALIARDEERLRALLSTERLNRISEAEAQGRRNTLRMFVQKERAKLLRELGERKSFLQEFRVSKVEMNDRSRMAASVSFDGKAIPRPIYFVQEAGGIRINITPPRRVQQAGTQSAVWYTTSDYLVESRTKEQTVVHCHEDHEVFAPGQKRYMTCIDFACGFLLDGTYFRDEVHTHFCDYNTWGSDFYMSSPGNGYCADSC